MEEQLREMEQIGFEFSFDPGGSIHIISPLPVEPNKARIEHYIDELSSQLESYEACIEIMLYKRMGILKRG